MPKRVFPTRDDADAFEAAAGGVWTRRCDELTGALEGPGTRFSPPAGPPIARFEFILGREDLADFERAALRLRSAGTTVPVAIAVGIAVLAAASIGYLAEPAPYHKAEVSQIVLFASMMAILIVWLSFLGIAALRRRATLAAWQAEHGARTVELFAEGVRSTGPFSWMFLPWASISLIQFRERLIIIWLSPFAGIPLPLAALGDAARQKAVKEEIGLLWRNAGAGETTEGGRNP